VRIALLVVSLGPLVPAARAQSVAWLVDSDLDQLFTVDLASGAATFVASTANNDLDTPSDLAWRADAQELWTVDAHDGDLGTIDTATGTFTPMFVTGFSGFQGLAWDPTTQQFFLTSEFGGVYRLDPAVGALVLVGPVFGGRGGLEVDSQGTLLGNGYYSPGPWYRYDKTTGWGTYVGFGLTWVEDLGLDEATGIWYATKSYDDSLYVVDPASGTTTLVGPHGGGVRLARGLEITPPPSPKAYCTAGTTTHGCTPSISASGTPSASASSGFTISVASVEGWKQGLVFYGIENVGFTPQPWAQSTSFLCVKAPTQRTPPQFSGGTFGQCDGSLSIDWCAFVAANPGALGAPFSAGARVFAQGWFRDPPSPKSTMLSDGLAFTVVP
jgi:hypothetical protein